MQTLAEMWSKGGWIIRLLFLALAFLVGSSSREPRLGSARVVFQVMSFSVFHFILNVWLDLELPTLQPKKSIFTTKVPFG